jgi:hypothetical protein
MSKLRNIKAVRQMLDGTHRFQTKTSVFFGDVKDNQRKSKMTLIDAEKNLYVDHEGKEWIIENGVRTRHTPLLDSIQEWQQSLIKCPKETCTCNPNERLDKKMILLHGMCFDCVIDMEHRLRMEGKFKEYERERLKRNALAWLKDAEKEAEAMAEFLSNPSQFVHESGEIEKWKLDDPEIGNRVREQFKAFREQFLKQFENESEPNTKPQENIEN